MAIRGDRRSATMSWFSHQLRLLIREMFVCLSWMMTARFDQRVSKVSRIPSMKFFELLLNNV